MPTVEHETLRDWDASRMPDQNGRVAVVTGANVGLGLVTAAALAHRGAHVIMAVRRTDAGEEAAARIRSESPGARVQVRTLDLASLSSVRDFAAGLVADHSAVDLLINNAGIVLLGPARRTADGFELHLGTNHLGHFALTGLLIGALGQAEAPRVVTLSSIVHKTAHLDFDDLMFERRYKAREAYGRSKLATTTFGLELDRRLRAAGSPILSVVAHPGISKTNLTPRSFSERGALYRTVGRLLLLMTQSAERGALPQLYAATAAGVTGGQFLGPSGFKELRGHVAHVPASADAQDAGVGRQLWTASEALTGVTFPLPDPVAARP